jgi:hypothetical protein
MTEKQKRIAELKKKLLEPPKPRVLNKGGGGDQKVDMQDKFRRVMHHGTPRLVTKNRQVNLNPANSDSRSLLMNIANVRKGVVDKHLNKQP